MGVGTVISFPSREKPHSTRESNPNGTGPTPPSCQEDETAQSGPINRSTSSRSSGTLTIVHRHLDQRLNVVFQGATGSGKSHLLCALAKSACRHRYRAVYVRMPDLAEQVAAAACKTDGIPKLVRKYSTYTLLAIDEWLVDKPDERFKSFLLELLERRYDTTSTAFATQLQTKEWHRQLGGDVIADAILDRIVHNAIWIDTGEYNMRKRNGQNALNA